MITPQEIQKQCLKWWKEVLFSCADTTNTTVSFFPKEITRIGKISAKDVLNKVFEHQKAIELLKNHSKNHTTNDAKNDTKGNKKLGYHLVLEEQQFAKIGKQLVPAKIIIESLEDYLKITKKEKEYQIFLKNNAIIQQELPLLNEWIKINNNILKLIEHTSWLDTLKVCQYFLATPKPQLYIRQLPINVHTKYIQENKGVITSLLNFLIPNEIDVNEADFEKRFNLLSREQLIRIRFLDVSKSPLPNITDISFTEKELKNYHLHYNFLFDNVFITENLMNFLTLPKLQNTIAIWSGGGFSISFLKNIEWLKEKQFYYWGDIDAQGFQILNQCRSYFPATISVMMDEETLENFQFGEGTPAKNQVLQHLSDAETGLYEYLKLHNIRLEQEKITQIFAEAEIKKFLEIL